MNRPISRRDFLKLSGLFPLLGLPSSSRKVQPKSSAPNVLVLVFDTLSARHISMFGYPRETMPNLANFAEKATVFHRNYSGGSFTSPGVGSILTGRYPSKHRALQAMATVNRASRESNFFRLFQQAGYHTLSFAQNLLVNVLANDFMEWVLDYIPPDSLALASKDFSEELFMRDYGIAVQAERSSLSPLGGYSNSLFLSLFSNFLAQREVRSIPREIRSQFPRELPQNHDLYYRLEDIMDWALEYIPNLPKPYAAYLHFMPPHDPYNPRQEFIGVFADQPADQQTKPEHFFSEGRDQAFLDKKREQYDEYIAYVDAEFGRLVSGLEAAGELDNTWLVLTSDHGELFERGIYRHITPVLYDPIVHVPLLIQAPGQTVRQDIHTLTSNVDILPTLLRQVGLATPVGLDGKLLPPWGAVEEERVIFAVDAKTNPKVGPLNRGTIAAMQQDQKLIHYFGYDGFASEFEYYDLALDPEELNNRYSGSSSQEQYLLNLINQLRG